MAQIPIYQPDLTGNEKAYVLDCLETGWISSRGEYVGRFERAFGEYLYLPYCSSVASGTAALQVAVAVLGIGPGDEVLVPTFTYVAPANAAAATGADVVFVDCLADSWQMDPAETASKVTDRTKAIIAVHLYGGMCPMDELQALARTRGLLLIEDCAEAFGSGCDGAYAGGFGDLATFSFYGNKTITTGEGGMVATRSTELHERVRRFKDQGRSGRGDYRHETIGFNYRMTNVAAAIGLAQVERADAIIAAKRRIADWYAAGLADLPVTLQAAGRGVRHTWWMVSILCDRAATAGRLREALAAAGVETRPLFPPVHTMPMYRRKGFSLPRAEDIAARGMNLPSWPGLTKPDVEFIADVIARFYDSRS